MTDTLIRTLLDWISTDSPQNRERLLTWAPELVNHERHLLRALTNLRGPAAVPDEVLAVEDELLQQELAAKPVTEATGLAALQIDPRLTLWRGDITSLQADAIVNAANPQLLGCFAPLHHCIDNAIHSAAGMRLRWECATIMAARGRPEPTGTATLTAGHNLPTGHVLHTVGPIVRGAPSRRDHEELAACYLACLESAAAAGVSSIAFCGISTGEYGFPQPDAARRAVSTVREALDQFPTIERVVINVFTSEHERYYRELLGPDA